MFFITAVIIIDYNSFCLSLPFLERKKGLKLATLKLLLDMRSTTVTICGGSCYLIYKLNVEKMTTFCHKISQIKFTLYSVICSIRIALFFACNFALILTFFHPKVARDLEFMCIMWGFGECHPFPFSVLKPMKY